MVPSIGITASTARTARRYQESIERRGGEARVLLPDEAELPAAVLGHLDGLVMPAARMRSPGHSWVMGVQCQPEREEEAQGFLCLFGGLLEWAAQDARRIATVGEGG